MSVLLISCLLPFDVFSLSENNHIQAAPESPVTPRPPIKEPGPSSPGVSGTRRPLCAAEEVNWAEGNCFGMKELWSSCTVRLRQKEGLGMPTKVSFFLLFCKDVQQAENKKYKELLSLFKDKYSGRLTSPQPARLNK